MGRLKSLKDRLFSTPKTEQDNGKPKIRLPDPELDLRIRPADIHDILPMALMWTQMTQEIFPDFVKVDKVELDKFAFAMADRLRVDHVFTRVAVHGAKIVGFIHGYFQERSYGQPNRTAFCETLFVYPEYRGKGLKDKLVKSFIDWAEANHLTIEFMTRYDPDILDMWGKYGAKPYTIVFRR